MNEAVGDSVIFDHLVSYLSVESVVCLSECSRRFNYLCERAATWRTLLARDYNRVVGERAKFWYKFEREVTYGPAQWDAMEAVNKGDEARLRVALRGEPGLAFINKQLIPIAPPSLRPVLDPYKMSDDDAVLINAGSPNEMVNLLTTHTPTWRTILAALERNRFEILRVLLRDGRADPSALDNWGLKTCVRNKRPRCVLLLLKDGRVDTQYAGDFGVWVKRIKR